MKDEESAMGGDVAGEAYDWRVEEEPERYGSAPIVPLAIRTRTFAVRIVKLFAALPGTPEAHVVGKQLLRCGSSVGAHYREGSRARSDAEFVSKLEVGIQELDESIYWMEILVETGIVKLERLSPLIGEANELMSILTACVKKAKSRSTRSK